MERTAPLLGERFPQISVRTTQGPKTLPDDYAGKWFVLFSHPADFTAVCTTEFVAFEERAAAFRALNCELIGLSVDQVFAHIKWLDWIRERLKVEISFPVIADDRGHVAERLGMLAPAKGSNTVRAVFVVDKGGAVRSIFFYPQELGRNIDELLRVVKGLQTADAHKVSLPANWPENSLIQNHGILPAATDVVGARRRLDEENCYDWWFCHKEL